MNLVNWALRRPVSVAMFFSALSLLGIISLTFLPLDLMPEVTYPVLTVTTTLGGYSPPEIEQTLTRPIEGALASLNNLVRLKSYSREGESEFRLAFEVGTEMDFVMQEVRERLNQLIPQFPTDTRTPRMVKYDQGSAPVMIVSLFGSLDPISLRLAGEEIIKKNLARVPGVASVEVHGGRMPEVLVEPKLEQLRALGLSVRELAEMLRESNLELALGVLDRGPLRIPLRSLGGFRNLEEIGQMGLMRTPSGSLVYLNQVATITYGAQDEQVISRYQGEPRVMVAMQREYGAHIVEVSAALRKALDSLQPSLPFGLKTEIIYDQGEFVVTAVDRLRNAGLLGGLFAVMVVWIFLRHWPSTLIITLAIPISIIVTFGFMYLTSISLNLVSLAGLTLGVCMLVDNAIVVVENIDRYQKAGVPRPVAAATGANEVLQAITAATLVHLAVFFPIFFFQKKVRLFYQDLCYTVSVALVISLLVAIVLVPVMMARFPSPRKRVTWLPRLAAWHRRHLIKVLRYRGWWLLGSALLLGVSLVLLSRLGFETTTRIDQGEFTLIIQNPPALLSAFTDNLARQAEQVILRQPEVKDVSTEVRENLARLRVRMVPQGQRQVSARELVERLRPSINALSHAHVHFQLERRGESSNVVTLEVSGPVQEALIKLALEVRARLASLPQLRDAVVHLKDPAPELEIRVDHQRAAYLGLSAMDVAHGIRSAITGPLASRLREPQREVELRTRLPAQDRGSLRVLQQLTVPQLGGFPLHVTQVPIWPAISLRQTMGSTEIHRINQRRALEISAETRDLDLYRAAALVQGVIDRLSPPPGYEIRLGYSFEELKEARREIFFAVILGLTLIYMIMAALFESFLTPLVILFSVPMAAVGMVMALWLTGYAISVAVYVGALALAGIVVNNAIVLVDHINRLRRRGQGYYQALLRGSQDRLRPILITSATAILGLLPMGLERREGAQLWSPLAWTVIGGLVSSTFLTLFIIPALYTLLIKRRPGRFRDLAVFTKSRR
jgi:HAE1 family hydrophobic/amphiphilic exporter-1